LIEMKTLKIVVVLTLAVVVAALLVATAYAYTGGVVAKSVPRGTAYGGYYGGMMGSGGMMRGYGYYNSAQAGTAPQQSGEPSTTTPTPSSQYPIDGWGCFGMRSRLP
jgi:hypothetical protein